MKTLTIIPILILLFAGCASWTKGERILLLSFAGSQALGVAQMEYARTHGGVHEQNGLFKGNEIPENILIKGAGVLSVYGLCELLPQYRTQILGLANLLGWGFVVKDQIVIRKK